MQKVLDFWIFGFLDFWIFLWFTLVFSICRNSSKIGFGKKGVCIGMYSVFKGCACRRGGGDHTYTYICIYVNIYTHTYASWVTLAVLSKSKQLWGSARLPSSLACGRLLMSTLLGLGTRSWEPLAVDGGSSKKNEDSVFMPPVDSACAAALFLFPSLLERLGSQKRLEIGKAAGPSLMFSKQFPHGDSWSRTVRVADAL